MKIDFSISTLIKHHEIIIASLLAVFIVFVLSLSLLIPNIERANQIFRESLMLTTRLSLLNKKESFLGNLDSQFFRDNFPKVKTVMPSEKDFVSLFTTLDSLQVKSGVTIGRTDLQFGVISTQSSARNIAPGSSAYMIPITLSITGDTSQVKKFVEGLSDLSGRLMTIEEIQWAFNLESGIGAFLTGRAYYYPLPSTIGSIDSPLPEYSRAQEEIHKNISARVELAREEEITDIPVGKKDLFN